MLIVEAAFPPANELRTTNGKVPASASIKERGSLFVGELPQITVRLYVLLLQSHNALPFEDAMLLQNRVYVSVSHPVGSSAHDVLA